LLLGAVLFINWKIDSNKNEKKKENLENNPNQQPSSNDNPTPPDENGGNNPPLQDTENWWLTDEEIEHAYQEIRKEITNSPEIQLVNPSVVRVIQEGGEISEELKNAKIIFFPINNSENHETSDSGNHWTLLVYDKKSGVFLNYNSLEFTLTPKNAMKVAERFHEKANLEAWHIVVNEKEIPRQTNGADCGVYVIAYARALIEKYKEEAKLILGEKDLIFSIAEERQKLKAAGFPKKDTPGKDYEIGDDVEYLKSEEGLISQWWPTKDSPYHPLRKCVRNTWNLDRESGEPYDHADKFKEFSKKVRLLSGASKIEKEKLNQIYRIKKILKACSLPLAEYKKTKSFNGKDNFREDKITAEESQFVRENINKEIVKEINDLYNTHFLGK